MPTDQFERTVFVNCPFDDDYAPLLEAAIFCVVYLGFVPRLANERIDGGENRLEKIFRMICESKYSIHDLSYCRATERSEYLRMNMPFELGLDVGLRRSGGEPLNTKRFLIFEKEQYDLKRALSDIAGQDVQYHCGKYEQVIKKIRHFFSVEAGVNAPGPSKLVSEYATFQGWMTKKKISEGHSEREAFELPTRERLDEMRRWVNADKPVDFNAQ